MRQILLGLLGVLGFVLVSAAAFLVSLMLLTAWCGC